MDPPSTLTLDQLHFIHDFALTRRYRVFFLSPVRFGRVRMLAGLASPVASMGPTGGRKARILVVPRAGGAALSISCSSGFVFHVANGYDEGDDGIVVDGTRWPGFPTFSDLGRAGAVPVYEGEGPTLTRFKIDLGRRRVSERRLCEYSTEFPAIDSRRVAGHHRFIWCNGAGLSFEEAGTAAVIKVDVESGTTILRSFAPDLPGEPQFVPRAGASAEDDGWTLLTVYRSAEHRTDLVVLDAHDLSPVCRAPLPHHLPPGFHGTWVEFDQHAANDG
jgi:all-trans-8'-apo-beta-carotenal 15,15'-oxygenase